MNDKVAQDVELDEEETIDSLIREAFDDGVESEAEEDDVKMAMIHAGATFKNVSRFYNKFMIDAGLAISKADRNQIVADTLEGLEIETEDDFTAAAEALADAMDNTSNRSAMSLIRSYAKKNELAVFVRPKGEVGTRPGFTNDYHKWLVSNNEATEQDAKAYILGEGDYADTTKNVKDHLSHYMGTFRFLTAVRADERANVFAELGIEDAAAA